MNRTVQNLIIVTSIALSSAVSVAQSPLTAPLSDEERAALFPSTADIEGGKVLAASACASCHALDGISTDENRPHLAGQRTVYLYRELLAYKNGARSDESMRRAVAFLSNDAMLKASIYYASLEAPRSAAAPVANEGTADAATENPLQAAKAAAAGCAGCHGATGNSSVPGMPNLTAQHPDYFAAAIKAYQSGSRPHATMKALVAALDDDTIQSMGLYYALQEPQRAAARGTGDPEAGKVLAQGCASCHGTDGNATAPDTPTLSGQDAPYLVKALKDYQNGQRDHALMVSAMAGSSDADIDAMATYYAAQEPAARQVPKPLTTAELVARCDRCHGPGGNSTDPRHPSLAGQHAKYLEQVIEAYVSGERSNVAMHAMSAPLKRGDIELIAAHYASRNAKSVVYIELPCSPADEE
jgi:cytochrome c553